MSEKIDRIQTKIRILKEVLDRGTFIIIAKGDPDFPDGLELPLPKVWKGKIKSAIKKLVKDLKNEISQIESDLGT